MSVFHWLSDHFFASGPWLYEISQAALGFDHNTGKYTPTHHCYLGLDKDFIRKGRYLGHLIEHLVGVLGSDGCQLFGWCTNIGI